MTNPLPNHASGQHVPPETYAAVFEADTRGAAILEELVRVFAKSAVTDGGIDAVLKTYYRAGARSVIDFLLRKIDRAHGVEPIEQEPSS